MKKVNSNDYYLKHIKNNLNSSIQKPDSKKNDTLKEDIQKELKKNFEKDEQNHYNFI